MEVSSTLKYAYWFEPTKLKQNNIKQYLPKDKRCVLHDNLEFALV